MSLKELILTLSLALCSFSLSAEASSCGDLYRQAYLEVYTENRTELQNAADIYLIYFDVKNDVAEARQEAAKLLADLATPKDKELKVIEELVRQIDSGELCADGRTMTWSEVLKSLGNF